ncbi:MAG: PstS family phosphate ABC transporter substrate-binding protein [Spirochaetes bacterium]|jgi:phosphate transport system substrate-binding protein|nr:PstS family phosphate ABC transporter substrate-binding protein [Spirochaetota bacterium]
MKTKKMSISLVAILLTLFIAVSGSCSREKTGETVVVKGSTTVLPITQIAAEAFREKTGIAVSIEGSGSGNGVKAIIDGTTDIGNSSRAMKPKELEEAKNNGVNVKEIIVAYDMIIPIVHPENPVSDLTLDQLKGIYDGSITNWSQVGGEDENITVISRDTSSGTYEVWSEKVLNKTDVSAGALLQASNGAVLAAVGANPRGIGYVGFGYLNDSVKPLQVNGVEGTVETGRSGEYPVSRPLYKYVNADKVSDNTQQFLDFLLGPEGQKLVKEAGFLPL